MGPIRNLQNFSMLLTTLQKSKPSTMRLYRILSRDYMKFATHQYLGPQVLLSAWRDKTLAELKEIDELEGMCRYGPLSLAFFSL